jgi:hypothetical protein
LYINYSEGESERICCIHILLSEHLVMLSSSLRNGASVQDEGGKGTGSHSDLSADFGDIASQYFDFMRR